MRIAVFGGSFNPPHLGHVLCAVYAQKIDRLDQVWVMPSKVHPYGKDMLPIEQRLEMCQLAFAGLEFIQVRDDELSNESGKTFDLIQLLKQREGEHQWFLIGGTDTVKDLPNWYRGAELMNMVEILAIPRMGYDHGSTFPLPDISSSMVRDRIAQNQVIDDLVPGAVEAYIAAHQLYR